MFCRNCGKQLSDTAKFCSGCGTPVARKMEAPKPVEMPQVEEPKPVEMPKTEEPKPVEISKVEEPKSVEMPKAEESKPVEMPKAEESKPVEMPKTEEPKQETQAGTEEQYVEDRQPEAPVPPTMPPYMPPQQPEKKKKKSGGVIIAIEIIVVIILLIAIAVGAIFLFKDKINLDNLKKDKAEETVVSEEAETAEEDTHFEDALSEGDFESVISEILDMDADAFKENEESLKDVLNRAITGHFDAAMKAVDEKTSSGDYIAAFDALDEEAGYREELAKNDIASEFAGDNSGIESKRENVLSDYQNAVFEEAESKGNQGSTDDVQAIFRESDKYLSGEDYENGKTKVYTRLVRAKLGSMQLNQEDAVVAMQYIDANLDLVRNDCWVLEFWDYFNALDEMKRGVSNAGQVTHRNADGYLLPDSDSRELTEADLAGFSKIECRLARYEIYARHGRGFSDVSVTKYFSNYGWYQEQISYQDFDEFSLSEIEMKNRDLIVKYEKMQGYR